MGAFSIGLIQLSPALLMSSNDSTLKGGWMLALYCLGGGETSLVTFLKIPVPQMNMYSRDLLNYMLCYADGRDLVWLCCIAFITGHTTYVSPPCWLCWVEGWNLFPTEDRQNRSPPHSVSSLQATWLTIVPLFREASVSSQPPPPEKVDGHVCHHGLTPFQAESLWAGPWLLCAGRLEGMSQTYAFWTFQYLLCINLYGVNEGMPLSPWANCCEGI